MSSQTNRTPTGRPCVPALVLHELATPENYDEQLYLQANPDVRRHLEQGALSSGRAHFDVFGVQEQRKQAVPDQDIRAMRAEKMKRVRPCLRAHADYLVDQEGRFDFLTEAIRTEAHIEDTHNVSSNNYDSSAQALIEDNPDWLILDCGAGSRSVYYANVVNYEIVPYPSTDVLGVGEHLPFKDGSFDAVLSFSVLEHVRDPFRCAEELIRVLKPGGRLICSIPFLQPLHGYPHHYFNASHEGAKRLFEDRLTIEDCVVPPWGHPIWSVSWILRDWANGLPPDTRAEFMNMRVADLFNRPLTELMSLPACRDLGTDAQFALAACTLLTAVKPDAPAQPAKPLARLRGLMSRAAPGR